MLPILVLLVASSALAAPSIQNINQLSINDNSQQRFRSLIDGVYNSFDGGEVSANELNIGANIRDRSRQGINQALTNGQALAYLGDVATARPGDACAAANYIDTYTRYVQSGNPAGVREALGNYIQVLIGNIDKIVGFATNKDSAKFQSVGARGSCPNEGRTYNFDAAWDIILGSARNANELSLTTELYCVAKRLYCGFSVVSNNVGATITASSLPLTEQVFDLTSGQLENFMSSLASRSNVGQSASALQQTLSAAVNRVTL